MLVVEDELDVQRFMAQVLTLEGAIVSTASTGTEAVALMRRDGPFQLVTLDIGLPDISGWDVLEAIRLLHPFQTSCPVVIISATSDKTTTDRASVSCAGFIAKPVTSKTLLKQLAPHVAPSLDSVS